MSGITPNHTCLPDEVVYNVLMRLDRADAINARAVCKRWREQLTRMFGESLHMQIRTLPYADRIWEILNTQQIPQPAEDTDFTTWHEVIRVNCAMRSVYGAFGISFLMPKIPLLYGNCLEQLKERRKQEARTTLEISWFGNIHNTLESLLGDTLMPDAFASAEDVRLFLAERPSWANHQTQQLITEKLKSVPLEIHHFTALTKLCIQGDQIQEIPEFHLPVLTILKITFTRVDAITNLTDLPKLTTLNLSNNIISRIENLNNLTNLTQIKMCFNNITNISSLSSASNLQILNLYNNDLVDITHLSVFTNLNKLDLAVNEVIDASPIEALTNLGQIDLTFNQIQRFPAFAQPIELYLDGNPCLAGSTHARRTNYAAKSKELYKKKASEEAAQTQEKEIHAIS
jgi:hypothetical protein